VSRISEASVEEVRRSIAIADVVGARTSLRRSGARLVGRCPFHEERTPSFSVDPTKGLYYCFGCQRGGDAIGFVMETEGLDFPAAVEWLGERYGVELEYEALSADHERRRDEQRRLLALLETAAAFYERFLWGAAEAAPARAYLAGRGIAEDAARAFRLGCAPSGWTRVCEAARRKGYSAQELERAGLAARGPRGPVDRFRGRLMFPLADAQGRVRGFGARQLPGGDPPKYLNSPDGPLFRKGDVLYGLDRARREIARGGGALVVEGYTDAIALHAAGMRHAVAAMGVALTEQQVTELRRLCESVTLAFDADAAGQEASLRGMELALGKGLEVRVLSLPDGADPADVVSAGGAEAFTRLLDGAEGYLAYRVGRAIAAGGGRDQLYRRTRTLLQAAPPSPERDEQLRRVVDRLGLSQDLAASLVSREPPRTAGAARRIRLTPRERDERLFLGLCLALPDEGMRLISKLDLSHFGSASHWEAAAHIRRRLAGETSIEESKSWASQIAELSALAAREGESLAVLHELYLKLQLAKVEDELKAAARTVELSLSDQQRLRELQDSRQSIRQAIRALAPEE
jgi:DNA primase